MNRHLGPMICTPTVLMMLAGGCSSSTVPTSQGVAGYIGSNAEDKEPRSLGKLESITFVCRGYYAEVGRWPERPAEVARFLLIGNGWTLDEQRTLTFDRLPDGRLEVRWTFTDPHNGPLSVSVILNPPHRKTVPDSSAPDEARGATHRHEH
jgi:hypothetical protein